VTITFDIDPTEYEQSEDTPEGVIQLAWDMMDNQTDYPDSPIRLYCEGVTKLASEVYAHSPE